MQVFNVTGDGLQVSKFYSSIGHQVLNLDPSIA